MLKIGNCIAVKFPTSMIPQRCEKDRREPVLRSGQWEITRGWYRQGWIFKDEEAFRNYPERPCYVPELSDTVYTGDDLRDLCDGQESLAAELFGYLDWEHPESALEDFLSDSSWAYCNKCGHLFSRYVHDTCPFCEGGAVGEKERRDE